MVPAQLNGGKKINYNFYSSLIIGIVNGGELMTIK